MNNWHGNVGVSTFGNILYFTMLKRAKLLGEMQIPFTPGNLKLFHWIE